MRTRKKIGLFILFPPLLLFAITGIVMWLWNLLLPEIIGVKAINFWQAMGILVLSKILFGGIHGKFGHKNCHFRHADMHHQKMCEMSDEDKEKLKEKFKERFINRFCRNQ